ncbi:MAG: response regulator [Actinomycetota bacterium]
MRTGAAMRALVVDDEPELADLLSRLLRKRFGAVVHVAGDGESTRRALCELDLDCVTLDYQLPDCDGLTLLREIQAGDSPPAVVLVTAHGDTLLERDAMELGAFSYITKDDCLVNSLSKAIEAIAAR